MDRSEQFRRLVRLHGTLSFNDGTRIKIDGETIGDYCGRKHFTGFEKLFCNPFYKYAVTALQTIRHAVTEYLSRHYKPFVISHPPLQLAMKNKY